MKQPARQDEAGKSPDWRNLRDDQGRLYGRVHRGQMLLELRQHNRTAVFDLKTILEIRQQEAKEVK